ncbi:MAG: alpha/beta hydrolase [Acidimicrobiia bacterium]|nr:alpha/beta hydrolase [Acidimicrobiia bacterium]
MAAQLVDVRVGAFTFRTRVAGPEAGEVVILLHGYPQTSWEWRVQLEALADAGYRAVAPDQRGYSPGARPNNVEDYTQEALVGDVLAIADTFDARRFHLVAHDWGAMLAWHVAAWHPERLRSLTIVSVPHPAALARALHDPSSDQADRFFYIPMFKDHREGEFFGSAEQMRAIFDASGLRGHDVAEHVEVLSAPEALAAATHWYRAFDYDAGDLGPVVGVPTLFVWSTDDPALGPDAARWTADHVRAPYRFEVLEGAPHWIPEAEADRLTALLLEHVRSTGAG